VCICKHTECVYSGVLYSLIVHCVYMKLGKTILETSHFVIGHIIHFSFLSFRCACCNISRIYFILCVYVLQFFITPSTHLPDQLTVAAAQCITKSVSEGNAKNDDNNDDDDDDEEKRKGREREKSAGKCVLELLLLLP
jgi:hypothetical protein